MKYGDDIIYDKSIETIQGYYDLVLIPGNKYEVHYGVHQGIYIYEGTASYKDMNHPHIHGQHMFRNCDTGKLSFGFFGYNSPYEFTSIVHPYKE